MAENPRPPASKTAGIRVYREPDGPLEDLLHSQDMEVLRSVAASSRLTEDLALTLLKRRDLPQTVLDSLSRNGGAMRHRKVILALVSHPRAPRHVTLPVTRRLYTFELMQLALVPGIAADLKVAIEETLISRFDTISTGERLTLAKRGSARVAAALLNDSEVRVVAAAMLNPQMTESWVVRALMNNNASPALVDAVCRDQKWSVRRDVQIALLRNQHTPLARAIACAQTLPSHLVRDVLRHSRLQPNIKTYLEDLLQRRSMAARKQKAQDESPGP